MTVVKTAVSALALYLLIRGCDLDWAEAASLVRRGEPMAMAVAVLGFPLLMAIKAWRWKLLARDLGLDYPMREAFLSYLAAFGIGVLTPGRLGEFAKGAYLARDLEASRNDAFASAVGDRLFDLVFLLVCGTVGLLRIVTEQAPWTLVLTALALLAVCYAGVGVSSHDWIWAGFLRSRFPAAMGFARSATRSFFTKTAVFLWALTVAAYGVYFAISYALIVAMKISVPPLEIVCVVAAVSLALLLPLTVAGLGQREALMVLLLGKYGIAPESAMSFSMLHFAVFYLAGGGLGLLAAWTRPLPRGLSSGLKAWARREGATETSGPQAPRVSK